MKVNDYLIQQLEVMESFLIKMGKLHENVWEPEKEFDHVSDETFENMILEIYISVFSFLEVRAYFVLHQNQEWQKGLGYLQHMELGTLDLNTDEKDVFIFRQKLGTLGCALAKMQKDHGHWSQWPKEVKKVFASVFHTYLQGVGQLLCYDLNSLDVVDYKTLLECLHTQYATVLVHYPLKEVMIGYYKSVSEEKKADIDNRNMALKQEQEQKIAAQKEQEEKKKELKELQRAKKERRRQKKKEALERKAHLAEESKLRQKHWREQEKQKHTEAKIQEPQTQKNAMWKDEQQEKEQQQKELREKLLIEREKERREREEKAHLRREENAAEVWRRI